MEGATITRPASLRIGEAAAAAAEQAVPITPTTRPSPITVPAAAAPPAALHSESRPAPHAHSMSLDRPIVGNCQRHAPLVRHTQFARTRQRPSARIWISSPPPTTTVPRAGDSKSAGTHAPARISSASRLNQCKTAGRKPRFVVIVSCSLVWLAVAPSWTVATTVWRRTVFNPLSLRHMRTSRLRAATSSIERLVHSGFTLISRNASKNPPICSVRIRDDISRRIECSFFLRGGYHERLGGRHRPDAFIIDIFCADCQQYLETELCPTGSIEAAVRTGQGELGNKIGYCDGLCQLGRFGQGWLQFGFPISRIDRSKSVWDGGKAAGNPC